MMEAQLRFGIFLAIFITVVVLEFVLPRRKLRENRWKRWGINLSIVAVNVILQRLTLGAAAYGAALYAQQHGWGLFHWISVPFAFEIILGVVLLDLAIYLQHVASHSIGWLWRIHQVHHADLDLDVTSGLRFHPVEILLSLIYKAILVLVLGIDPWIVIVYEAILNGAAIFTHGNIAVPVWLDRALRLVICTPDMHRIHHSTIRVETDSNYGNFLSVWDRLFSTFRPDPEKGQTGMVLGLPDEQDQRALGLLRLLRMPFEKWLDRRPT